MYRADREVTDKKSIIEFLKEEKVCRIGLYDGKQVYIVPLNYAFNYEEGENLVFYLHGAKVGRKIDIIRKNPNVCIEIDGRHMLEIADTPCEYGYFYMSLIGNGKLELVDNLEDKRKILSNLMLHQTGEKITNFTDKWINAVGIMKLELTDFTVKEHKK